MMLSRVAQFIINADGPTLSDKKSYMFMDIIVPEIYLFPHYYTTNFWLFYFFPPGFFQILNSRINCPVNISDKLEQR